MVFVDLADPFNSAALRDMIYLGRAKLNESEQLTYDIWRLWKFYGTKPYEIYPDINREQAARAFLQMENYYQDRQRMDREKKKQRNKYRGAPIEGYGYGGHFWRDFERTHNNTIRDVLDKLDKLEAENAKRRGDLDDLI